MKSSFSNIFILVLLFTAMLLSSFHHRAFANEDDIYYYNGIPGCSCFMHCICDTDLFNPPRTHDMDPACTIWHAFTDKINQVKGSLFRTSGSEF